MIHVLLVIEDRILLKSIYELLSNYINLSISICPYSMDAANKFQKKGADLVILDSSIFLPYEKILNSFNQKELHAIILTRNENEKKENSEFHHFINANRFDSSIFEEVMIAIQKNQTSNLVIESNIFNQLKNIHEKCLEILDDLLANRYFEGERKIQELYLLLKEKNQNSLLWEYVHLELHFINYFIHGNQLHFPYSEINEEMDGILSSSLVKGVNYNSRNNEEILSKCAKIIFQNWNHELYVDGIAEELNHNKEYLNRIFTEQFHMSITKAIHTLKIQNAKYFLLFSEKTACEISTLTGFHDNGYFTKVFKKETGFSPLAFRNLRAHYMPSGILNSTLFERNFLYESIMAIQ